MDNPDIQSYKNAVWDYLLEHCDITENGALFIKFHTSSRVNFEKHVRARLVYNYHREDPRKKEAAHIEKRTVFETEKQKKKQRYKDDKVKRREEQEKIAKELKRTKAHNRRVALVRNILHTAVRTLKKMSSGFF